MFKKLTITIICIFFLAFHANAGSDGELVLKKDQPQEIKDCFEKLNRALQNLTAYPPPPLPLRADA